MKRVLCYHSPMKNLENLSILYVEDEEGTRNNLRYYLENSFKKVFVATTGEEGLMLFQNEPTIDVVMSDIHMPKMDGLEMIRKIKQINPNVACLLTTAYNDQEYLLEAIELGVFSYVLKPVDVTLLFEKLRLACERLYEQKQLSFLSAKMSAITSLDMVHFSKALDAALDELASKDKKVTLCNLFHYDFNTKKILAEEHSITLSNQEIELLEYLITHKNEIVPYATLMHHLSTQNPSLELVRTIVKSIRKKTTKGIIINLSGVGYKIGMHV
ncbi:response regulator [Sulfurospirillum barnesii]|nr:response regulator [Sulfurospirillum barnesii]